MKKKPKKKRLVRSVNPWPNTSLRKLADALGELGLVARIDIVPKVAPKKQVKP